ncbi:MAG: zinc-dependent alcohol dehydrogenase family protein [Deltaproteobacteria bacterium]|nr:zinc-dependent alcohol dehydrogenase family protein [Deltaproteobacteria bacterium]
MKALALEKIIDLGKEKEALKTIFPPLPEPASGEIMIKVSTCGVCHTELDEIEGRTAPPRLPVIPGHQVVGRVAKKGKKANAFNMGDRVGVAWIYSACGKCDFCTSGRENLCSHFVATGRDVNGGYAQYMTVSEKFAHAIPDIFSDVEAAPLLCAGAIGFRALKLSGIADGAHIGLTGFGASNHIVMKLARHLYPAAKIYVFARSQRERDFALELGACWSGKSDDKTPEKLHAVIDTTPAWKPVIHALSNLKGGGRLVINAIGKEEHDKDCLLEMDYPSHLWMEKEIKSVANITRDDVSGFLKIAAQIPIKSHVQVFHLEEANKALAELKEGKIRGAKVLQIG